MYLPQGWKECLSPCACRCFPGQERRAYSMGRRSYAHQYPEESLQILGIKSLADLDTVLLVNDETKLWMGCRQRNRKSLRQRQFDQGVRICVLCFPAPILKALYADLIQSAVLYLAQPRLVPPGNVIFPELLSSGLMTIACHDRPPVVCFREIMADRRLTYKVGFPVRLRLKRFWTL